MTGWLGWLNDSGKDYAFAPLDNKKVFTCKLNLLSFIIHHFQNQAIGFLLAMCLLGCTHSSSTNNRLEAETDPWIMAWYQTYVSPIDGDRCPMTPSCSSYAQKAVHKQGFFLGWIMTCERLIRCGRDETRLSPHIAENNGIRVWDPVWMNDLWLIPNQESKVGGQVSE